MKWDLATGAAALLVLLAAPGAKSVSAAAEPVARAEGQALAAEQALRMLLADLARGVTDLSRLSGGAAQDVPNFAPVLREQLQRLGPVKSVRHTGPDQFGSDAFEIEFERGEANWLVALAPDHTIQGLGWRIIRIPPPPREALPRLLADLGRTLDQAAAADEFSGAVAVAQHGRVRFARAYGFADRERRIPNTLETRFRIASMSKMFTAVAVLQLAQAGRLRLDAPVGDYLPDYPNRAFAQGVTVHQLLTHTGGAGDIFGPAFDQHRQSLRHPADYIAAFGDRAPEFPPGSRFGYSNYGYVVLGRIVEMVSGQDYDAYVQDHIFTPAGMTRTGALAEEAEVPGRSVPYGRDGAGFKATTGSLPLKANPAAGAYSTVGDLLRFADALTGERLLDRKHAALLTGAKIKVRDGVGYAYGFEDRTDRGFEEIGHGGDNPGVNGDFRVVPSEGLVVVSLANLGPPAAKRFSDFVLDRLEIKAARPQTGARP